MAHARSPAPPCPRPVPGGSLAGFAKLWVPIARFKAWAAGLGAPAGRRANAVPYDIEGRPRAAGCDAPGAYSLC